MAYEKTAKKGSKIGVLVGILAVIAAGYIGYSAVHTVDAGHRGVLLHWNAVDTSMPPLAEGLHLVSPISDYILLGQTRGWPKLVIYYLTINWLENHAKIVLFSCLMRRYGQTTQLITPDAARRH